MTRGTLAREVTPRSAVTGRSQLSSLERGLRILSYVQDRGQVSVAEIVRELGIPMSSTYRYATSLIVQGYLVEMDGHLVASARLAESASDVETALPRIAGRHLDGLVAATSLSVALTVRVHTAAICLDTRRVQHAALAYRKGQALALHAGASSTPLLAFAPSSVREKALSGRLAKFTSATPSVTELAAELPVIRETGYHLTRGWLTPGMSALGVPVMAESGCVAALSLIGRDGDVAASARLLNELQAAAHSITADLDL